MLGACDLLEARVGIESCGGVGLSGRWNIAVHADNGQLGLDYVCGPDCDPKPALCSFD